MSFQEHGQLKVYLGMKVKEDYKYNLDVGKLKCVLKFVMIILTCEGGNLPM